jgi:hypothetical protein
MDECSDQALDTSLDEDTKFRELNTEKYLRHVINNIFAFADFLNVFQRKLTSLFNMNAEILFKIESISNNMIMFTKQQQGVNSGSHFKSIDNSSLLFNIQRILSENERLKICDLNNNCTSGSEGGDEEDSAIRKLTEEVADLQNQLEICTADLKIERTIRKSIESRLAKSVEEVKELQAALESSNRQVEERKRKFDVDTLMLNLKRDAEIEEMSRLHVIETDELKEKLKKVFRGFQNL